MKESLIALMRERLAGSEVGSPQHEHYTQMLKEMTAVTLHVADEGICESCQ